jgi:hypothetical protein
MSKAIRLSDSCRQKLERFAIPGERPGVTVQRLLDNRESKVDARPRVFNVRIDYDDDLTPAMKRMSVTATSRLSAFPWICRLLEIEFMNLGQQRRIKAITIESE